MVPVIITLKNKMRDRSEPTLKGFKIQPPHPPILLMITKISIFINKFKKFWLVLLSDLKCSTVHRAHIIFRQHFKMPFLSQYYFFEILKTNMVKNPERVMTI